jgi:mRNA interferase RelE/StbE
MAAYRPDIPTHVAEIIRHLPPDVKRSVEQTLRSLSADPFSGVPLMRELSGLWKFKVRRFRMIYELDRKARIIRIFAIDHRREVYEELADQLRQVVRKNAGRWKKSSRLIKSDSTSFALPQKFHGLYQPSRQSFRLCKVHNHANGSFWKIRRIVIKKLIIKRVPIDSERRVLVI